MTEARLSLLRPKQAMLCGVALLLVASHCNTNGSRSWTLGGEEKSATSADAPAGRINLPDEQARAEPADQTLSAVAEFLARTKELAEEPQPAVKSPVSASSESDLAATSAKRAEPAIATERTGHPAGSDRVDPDVLEDPSRTASALPHADADLTARANVQMVLEDQGRAARHLVPPRLLSLHVRQPDVEPAAAPGKSPSEAESNRRVAVESSCRAPTLDGLAESMEREPESERGARDEWALRLVQLAADRPIEMGAVGAEFSPVEQAVLRGYLRLGQSIGGLLARTSDSGDEALDRVEELRLTLADRAAPRISGVVLCRKVLTYGVYEEMAESEFVTYQPVQTIVYIEVRNLHSERTEDGQYRSVVWTRLELLSADGKSLWEREEPEIVDLCRGKRTDFFIAQRVTFPANLPEGEHVLKVSVEDRLSGYVQEVVRPVRFLSAPSVAQSRR